MTISMNVAGWNIEPSNDLFQVQIISNLSSKHKHFTRVATLTDNQPVRSLCRQEIKNYSTFLGYLFQYGIQTLDLDHAPDFCQSCKRRLRQGMRIRMFSHLMSDILPQAYSGQPLTERFCLFYCAADRPPPKPQAGKVDVTGVVRDPVVPVAWGRSSGFRSRPNQGSAQFRGQYDSLASTMRWDNPERKE